MIVDCSWLIIPCISQYIVLCAQYETPFRVTHSYIDDAYMSSFKVHEWLVTAKTPIHTLIDTMESLQVD